jgi:molecular chaperone Hsp33
MNDYLIRTISEKANVIGLACITSGLVEEAARLHETSPTVSAALGRALTGGLLLGCMIKEGQRVGLKFEGNGPLKKIVVEADSKGCVRGLVESPSADAPPRKGKLDVSGVVGREGFLTVLKDIGLKEPYQGIVKLRTGEIAEDIAFYLSESEQIPSAVGLGVFVEPDGKVSAAGGFMIQSLPPSEGPVLDQLEKNIGKMPSVTEMIRRGKLPEDMLAGIFAGIDYRVIEKRGLSYCCTCNRDRIERILISLGCDELNKLKSEREEIQVTCEFCRTRYSFNRGEIQNLLDEMGCSQEM